MTVLLERPPAQRRHRWRRPEDPKTALLAGLPLFEGVPRRALASVAPLLEHVDLPAGHVLVQERAPQRELFLLVEGCAEASLDGRLLGVARAGELLGDPALVRGTAPVTWVAASDVTVLLTTPHGFGELVDRLPDLLPRLWGEH